MWIYTTRKTIWSVEPQILVNKILWLIQYFKDIIFFHIIGHYIIWISKVIMKIIVLSLKWQWVVSLCSSYVTIKKHCAWCSFTDALVWWYKKYASNGPSGDFQTIFHEHNSQADGLSKHALKLDMGCGTFSEILDGMVINHGQLVLF